MYIEKNQAVINLSMSGSRSDDQVNEATAALKGMLGIGGASSPSSAAVVDTSSTTKTTTIAATPVKGGGEAAPEPQEPVPKKSKKKNKKKKKKEGATRTPTAPPKKQESGGGGPSGRKKKQDKAKAPKKDKSHSDKFAWSAFQASPDASTLPMPAFSPQVATKRTVVNTETVVAGLMESTSTSGITTVEAKDDVAEDPSLSASERSQEKSADDIVNETEPMTTLESPPPAKREETEADTKEEPASNNTGINLAALAASPPSQPMPSPPAPSTFPTSNVLPPSYPQPPPPPPMYNTHNNNMSPPPPLPQQSPQYVTIHVQVPPVLLPGRHMVVASPMGFPVQVRVPDGVPPGMIIPVHVPLAPPPPQQQQQQQRPPPPPPVYNNPYLYGGGRSPP